MELETYLTQSVKVGYGKTRREVKAIVENVAVDKGVLRGSCISDGWWRRFLERHPQLSLRCGDATGHVRMNAMTRDNLTNYFNLLRDCFKENGLKDHPEQIYNMDESGILTTTVFRKKTHTDKYLAFDSHHPITRKIAVAKTLFNEQITSAATSKITKMKEYTSQVLLKQMVILLKKCDPEITIIGKEATNGNGSYSLH